MTFQKMIKEYDYKGKVVYTAGVQQAMEEDKFGFGKDVLSAVMRFNNLDFGELCEEDNFANMLAIKSGLESDRVVARYNTCEDPIYIIAEKYSENEVVVTILFTHEY